MVERHEVSHFSWHELQTNLVSVCGIKEFWVVRYIHTMTNWKSAILFNLNMCKIAYKVVELINLLLIRLIVFLERHKQGRD
jgi:hypothetical protein